MGYMHSDSLPLFSRCLHLLHEVACGSFSRWLVGLRELFSLVPFRENCVCICILSPIIASFLAFCDD